MNANDPLISKDTLFDVINFLLTDIRSPGQLDGPSVDSHPSFLNPQPLPPRVEGISRPEPWKAAAVSRYVIRMAAISRAAAANDEDGMRAARGVVKVLIDDFCGTVPGRGFQLPAGWPRIDVKPSGLDVLVAAAGLHAAAKAMKDDPMSPELAAASDRLLSAGLQRLAAKQG